jgi:hypothetical protein
MILVAKSLNEMIMRTTYYTTIILGILFIFCQELSAQKSTRSLTDSFKIEKSRIDIYIPESKKQRKKTLLEGFEDSMTIFIMENFDDTIEILLNNKVILKRYVKTKPSLAYTGISVGMNTENLNKKETKIIFRLLKAKVQSVFRFPDNHYVAFYVSRFCPDCIWFFRLTNYRMKMM